MMVDGKDIRKWTSIIIIVALGVLTFILLRPVIMSILAGLILAYIFFPLYNKIKGKVKNDSLAASLVSGIILLIIMVPLWFVIPVMVDQVFAIFQSSQQLDIQSFIRNLFPGASDGFIVQATLTINSVISKMSAGLLNSMVDIFLNTMTILLHLFIVGFVFFYTLRDANKLKELARSVSPLDKPKEKVLTKQFTDITNSLIYGQVIIGVVQGILAGIGLFIFGVPNALVLALVATLASVIPIIGPGLVWVPITIYLFIIGSPGAAIGYLIYNFVVVFAFADNILRYQIVSKRARVPPVLVLVGMIGGLFIFGVLGLIIGPLILAYFITFLQSYKEETKFTLLEKDKKPLRPFRKLVKSK